MSGLLTVCICFIALIVSGNTEDDGYDDAAIAKGDIYIDQLLKDMFEDRVEEYDPYRIEDSVVGFHRKIAFVNVSGEAKLHDGYITGLKTLHRPNHCSLKEENGRLNVKADLGAGVLDFHYSGSVKFMNFGPTITVHGTLGYLEVHMEFNVDAETGRDGKLTKFVIDDMRGMQVWITGLGPMNWAVNPIISGVMKIFKRFLRNFMENKVEKHIAERIPNFQFPIEGVDITSLEPTSSSKLTEQPTTEDSTETKPVTDSENEVTEEIVETTSPSKPEEPETDEPLQTEEPETDEPLQTEEPETDEPLQTEEPETDEPLQTEEPETDEPLQTEEPETDEPLQTEEPETDEPLQTEEPETDEPLQPEEPETDEPLQPEEPETDEPLQPEEPETDEPLQPEEPETDEPLQPEEPETDEPLQPEEPETDESHNSDTQLERDEEPENSSSKGDLNGNVRSVTS